jgi:hypothetical protein
MSELPASYPNGVGRRSPLQIDSGLNGVVRAPLKSVSVVSKVRDSMSIAHDARLVNRYLKVLSSETVREALSLESQDGSGRTVVLDVSPHESIVESQG